MPDSMLFWSDIAAGADRADREGRGAQARRKLDPPTVGVVYLALYDAYVAVERPTEFAPHLPGLPVAPAGASVAAAMAGAAHEVLSALFPDQRALFDAKLAEASVEGDPGLPFGRRLASVVLSHRDQPRETTVPFTSRCERIVHLELIQLLSA